MVWCAFPFPVSKFWMLLTFLRLNAIWIISHDFYDCHLKEACTEESCSTPTITSKFTFQEQLAWHFVNFIWIGFLSLYFADIQRILGI